MQYKWNKPKNWRSRIQIWILFCHLQWILVYWHCWIKLKLLSSEVILQSRFCYNTNTPFNMDLVLKSIFAMTFQPTRLQSQAASWFLTNLGSAPPGRPAHSPSYPSLSNGCHYPSLSNGCPLPQPLKWGCPSLRLGGRCPISDSHFSQQGQLCPKLWSGDGGRGEVHFLVAMNSWEGISFYINNCLLCKSYHFYWIWT